MNLVLLLLLGLVLLWGIVVAHTAWMLTHPPRRTYASAVARGRPGDPSELERPREFREWRVRWRGLELPAWEIAGDRPDGPAVVMVHGWGDSRIGALSRLEAVIGEAARVIAWDLPGHGDSPGVCRLGVDEVQALAAVLEGVHEPVVLYGWSLGAGVCLALAGREEWRERVVGVIAETPYRLAPTPARNVMRLRGLPHAPTLRPALALVSRLLAAGGLATGRFDRARHAHQVRCPVLVVHGEFDEVCPLEDGQAIASAAGESGATGEGTLAVIPGGTHNELWKEPMRGRCVAAVQDWLREVAKQGVARHDERESAR